MLEFATLFLFLCGLSIACLELGDRLGRRGGPTAKPDRGVLSVDGFVLTLLGLLLAFSLTSSRDLFNQARAMSIREADAIRSTRFLINGLSGDYSREFLKEFDEYRKFRYEYGAALLRGGDLDRPYSAGLERLGSLQHMAIALADRSGAPGSVELIRLALDDVQSAALERHVLETTGQPVLPAFLLLSLASLAAVLVGRDLSGDRRAQWLPRLTFAVPVAFVMAMIFDYESPRLGVIRLDTADRMLNSELAVEPSDLR